jgi:hypothetical protein
VPDLRDLECMLLSQSEGSVLHLLYDLNEKKGRVLYDLNAKSVSKRLAIRFN